MIRKHKILIAQRKRELITCDPRERDKVRRALIRLERSLQVLRETRAQ